MKTGCEKDNPQMNQIRSMRRDQRKHDFMLMWRAILIGNYNEGEG